MAVWGHLFNTLGSCLWPRCGNTTGGISHAPIVNLPILFTNTDHDNQPDLPVWIASDIICLNLLKAHVGCGSLEWPWCVTLTVHCHLKSQTTKWKQLWFLLLWSRPTREALKDRLATPDPPYSPETHAPVKLISPIPMIIFRDVVGQKLPTELWTLGLNGPFMQQKHILTLVSSDFLATLLKL